MPMYLSSLSSCSVASLPRGFHSLRTATRGSCRLTRVLSWCKSALCFPFSKSTLYLITTVTHRSSWNREQNILRTKQFLFQYYFSLLLIDIQCTYKVNNKNVYLFFFFVNPYKINILKYMWHICEIQYNLRIPKSDKTGILPPPDATLDPEFFLLISIVKYTLKTGIWEFWIPDKITSPCMYNYTLIVTRKPDIARLASPLVDNQLIA